MFRKGQETVAFPERPILSVVEQLDFHKLRKQKKGKPKERLVLRARTREAPSRPYLSKPCFHRANMRYHKASFTKGIRLQTRSIKNEVGPYFKCKELEPKKRKALFLSYLFGLTRSSQVMNWKPANVNFPFKLRSCKPADLTF